MPDAEVKEPRPELIKSLILSIHSFFSGPVYLMVCFVLPVPSEVFLFNSELVKCSFCDTLAADVLVIYLNLHH